MGFRESTVLFLALVSLAEACADNSGEGVVAKRKFPEFQREVYPVLLRDCGFPACHGDPRRFFRVYGPGRVRIAKDDGTVPSAFDQPTGDEISLSYNLAQSMIDPTSAGKSLLLRKPLAVAAGGAGHLGVDSFDRDVYRTAQDEGYLVIAHWVYSDDSATMSP